MAKYRFMMNVLYNNGSYDNFEVGEFNEGDKFDVHRLSNPNISTLWFFALKPALASGALIFSKKTDPASVSLLEAHQKKLPLPQLMLSIVHHHVRESNIYRGKVLEDQWLLHDRGWFQLATVTSMTSRLPSPSGTIDVITIQAKKTAHQAWGGPGSPMDVGGTLVEVGS
jgi:hypothetical protein